MPLTVGCIPVAAAPHGTVRVHHTMRAPGSHDFHVDQRLAPNALCTGRSTLGGCDPTQGVLLQTVEVRQPVGVALVGTSSPTCPTDHHLADTARLGATHAILP